MGGVSKELKVLRKECSKLLEESTLPIAPALAVVDIAALLPRGPEDSAPLCVTLIAGGAARLSSST